MRWLGLKPKESNPTVHKLRHGRVLSNGGIVFDVKEVRQAVSKEDQKTIDNFIKDN
jgi:hypothetical protein